MGAVVVGVIALFGVGAVVYFKYRNGGGAKQLGQDLAEGVIDAASGVVSGVATGVSHGLGISAPDETLRDVNNVRDLIGQAGVFEASKRASAPAFFKALLAGPTYYGHEGDHGLAALPRPAGDDYFDQP